MLIDTSSDMIESDVEVSAGVLVVLMPDGCGRDLD